MHRAAKVFETGVLAILVSLMAASLGYADASAQSGDHVAATESAKPPRLLYISREYWKKGSQANLDRIEAAGARMCIERECPHPYLGIESLTGSKEVWYLNGFASSEEAKHVSEEYKKKNLFAAMKPFVKARAPFASAHTKAGLLDYRPELSRGAPWKMGYGQFLIVAVTRHKSPGEGSVFEAKGGLRIVVTQAETRADADAKLASAGPGAKLFVVRPRFSMPSPQWIAADPSFWGAWPTIK